MAESDVRYAVTVSGQLHQFLSGHIVPEVAQVVFAAGYRYLSGRVDGNCEDGICVTREALDRGVLVDDVRSRRASDILALLALLLVPVHRVVRTVVLYHFDEHVVRVYEFVLSILLIYDRIVLLPWVIGHLVIRVSYLEGCQ